MIPLTIVQGVYGVLSMVKGMCMEPGLPIRSLEVVVDCWPWTTNSSESRPSHTKTQCPGLTLNEYLSYLTANMRLQLLTQIESST